MMIVFEVYDAVLEKLKEAKFFLQVLVYKYIIKVHSTEDWRCLYVTDNTRRNAAICS